MTIESKIAKNGTIMYFEVDENGKKKRIKPTGAIIIDLALKTRDEYRAKINAERDEILSTPLVTVEAQDAATDGEFANCARASILAFSEMAIAFNAEIKKALAAETEMHRNVELELAIVSTAITPAALDAAAQAEIDLANSNAEPDENYVDDSDGNGNTDNNVDIANVLPTGNITVNSGAVAWAIVGKYFPNGIHFNRASKGFNREDVFSFTNDQIIYANATCTPDNSRIECIEVINSNESGSARHVLSVCISHDTNAEIELANVNNDNTDDSNDVNNDVNNEVTSNGTDNHAKIKRTPKRYAINPVIDVDDEIKFNHLDFYLGANGSLQFDGHFNCKYIETAYRQFRNIMAQAANDITQLNGWGYEAWLPANKISECYGNFFNENGDLLFTDNDPRDTLAVDINEDTFYFFANFSPDVKPLDGFNYDASTEYQLQTNWENPHDFSVTGDLSNRNINGRITAQRQATKGEHTLHDDFNDKLAKLQANANDAKANLAEKQAALDKAQEEFLQADSDLEDANRAINQLGDAKAKELRDTLFTTELLNAPKMTITAQNGNPHLTKLKTLCINFDCFDHNFFITVDKEASVITFKLATYDTTEQVTCAVNLLKDAIKRGDKEFTFPTADELNQPSATDFTSAADLQKAFWDGTLPATLANKIRVALKKARDAKRDRIKKSGRTTRCRLVISEVNAVIDNFFADVYKNNALLRKGVA